MNNNKKLSIATPYFNTDKELSKKKLNIAYVADAIYPYNKGGKEKKTYELSTRLALKGHKVTIYCMKWWEGENTIIRNGVTFKSICKFYPLYSGQKRSIKQGILFGLSCLKLIKEDFDVIDVDHMPYFPMFFVKIICLIKGKGLIGTWNEVWGRKYWLSYLGNRGNLAYLLERLSVLMPNRIISISSLTTHKLMHHLKVSKLISTIDIGVDINLIGKIRKSKIESDIIYAGRLLSHKNIYLLIKSIQILKKSMPDIKCLIVGEGPEKIYLEQTVKKNNLERNIIFTSFIEKDSDLYSLFKSSKVFILPSTREGFGMVVIEAHACGLPVLTINHPNNASKNLINLGNGLLSNFNAIDIAKNAAILLKNSSKMRLACIASAKQYNWGKIISTYEGVYRQ